MAEKITIGEFAPLIDGVEIAEVGGADTERAVGILSTRPPFEDAQRAEQLNFEDFMEAKRLAVRASGVGDVAIAAGKLDNTIASVVFSKTGALAVRYDAGQEADSATAIGFIARLDDNNFSVNFIAHEARIG